MLRLILVCGLVAAALGTSYGGYSHYGYGPCNGHYDGYIGNAGDATTFIQCSNGLAILQNCAEGTTWDQASLACQGEEAPVVAPAAPAAAPAVDAACTNGPDGITRNPNDCASFIQCSNGSPVVQQCSYGTQWSTHLNTCVDAPYSDCGNYHGGYGGNGLGGYGGYGHGGYGHTY